MNEFKDLTTPAYIVLAAALAVAGSYLIGERAFAELALGLAIFAILISIVYNTILWKSVNRMLDELSVCRQLFDAKEKIIVPIKEMIKYESSLKEAEIWVLTCDLSYDIEGKLWKTVKKNISKNRNRYVYLLPNTQKDRYEQLTQLLGVSESSNAKSISPRYIEHGEDLLLCHFVLYNPYYDAKCRAYMLTPTADNGFAIALDTKKATELQGKLRRLEGTLRTL